MPERRRPGVGGAGAHEMVDADAGADGGLGEDADLEEWVLVGNVGLDTLFEGEDSEVLRKCVCARVACRRAITRVLSLARCLCRIRSLPLSLPRPLSRTRAVSLSLSRPRPPARSLPRALSPCSSVWAALVSLRALLCGLRWFVHLQCAPRRLERFVRGIEARLEMSTPMQVGRAHDRVE